MTSHILIPSYKLPAGHLVEFGAMGVGWVAGELRERGYCVRDVSGHSDYDLIVNCSARVEVKSATRGGGGGREGYCWQFSLRRHKRDVNEDLVFLLCYEDTTKPPACFFAIPGHVVGRKMSKISITSFNPRTYAGRFAHYRDDWTQMEAALQRRRGVQLSLDDLFKLQEVQEEIPF